MPLCESEHDFEAYDMKSSDALLEPDARFLSMAAGCDLTGAVRMMAITDLYDQMQEIQLDPAVPSDIVEQFDKARHAFIYSWFAYDLVSLSEQQGYQTLELALREKLPANERKKADDKRWTLDTLLKRAVAHHWIERSDFYDPDTKICMLDIIPRFRNELAHGSRNLFPVGSHVMLELCAEIINKLFQENKTEADG
jgi:hypothetical protein